MASSEFEVKGNGKLLITGEYFVLDGALAFALPCSFGQTFRAIRLEEPNIYWRSYTADGDLWIDTKFSLPLLSIQSLPADEIPERQRLFQILNAIQGLSPDLLDGSCGYQIETRLEFPNDWGLGSSSTLIYCLSQWAKIDPYELLSRTFKGSGYDLACAGADAPIVYHREGQSGLSHPVDFDPEYADQLFFVHLNQKQNSREGIKMYRERIKSDDLRIKQITELTHRCYNASDLESFIQVLEEHENLISEALGLDRVQALHFSDFPGVVKSLGAWGGDFVLAASSIDPSAIQDYFISKGFKTVIAYRNMVIQPWKAT